MIKQREKTGWPYRLTLVAAAFLLMVGMGGGLGDLAYAGSCASGSTCLIELTHANITQLDGNIDVRVTWNNTGSVTVFSVQWISGGPGTPKDISEFGYNSSVGVTNITGGGLFTDWTATASANIDGFGTFATDEMRNDGTFGVSAPIVFTLASKITSIPDNNHGAEFVVHIAWGTPDCSGFVSDGTTTSQTSNTNCGGAQVPEPASLLLLGSGLAGLGLWQWKRRKGVQV